MKNFKLRRPTAIIGYTVLAVVLFYSCNQKPEFNPNRAFILMKSDDNNWTTSGIIECDSINMISHTECDFWIDGHRSKMFGEMIKLMTNPYFNHENNR